MWVPRQENSPGDTNLLRLRVEERDTGVDEGADEEDVGAEDEEEEQEGEEEEVCIAVNSRSVKQRLIVRLLTDRC